MPTPGEQDKDYGCNPRARCSNTQTAWKLGCRHPGAVAAHEQWLDRKRARRAEAAAGDECVASTHGTRYAYEYSGCRCPEAVTARLEHDRVTKRNYRTRQRQRDYAAEYGAEVESAKRKTGGRLDHDPRRPWRGGKMAVSEVSVLLLMTGVSPGDATMMEKMVALIRLKERRVWDDGEMRKRPRWRPLKQSEIVNRTGMAETVQRHLTRKQAELRKTRSLRRLADSQWKVAVAAESAGRKERERERHMRLRAERELRAELRKMARIRAEQMRSPWHSMPWLRPADSPEAHAAIG